MPDGSHVVKIDGQLYRALSPAKVEELANQKDALKVCTDNQSRYILKVESAEKDVTIANQRTAIEHLNFVGAMKMYDEERKLRVEASSFIPHGHVGGFGGAVLKATDSPWFQAFIKVVVPTYTAWKTSTR